MGPAVLCAGSLLSSELSAVYCPTEAEAVLTATALSQAGGPGEGLTAVLEIANVLVEAAPSDLMVTGEICSATLPRHGRNTP
jgi:hypothetical protein